jgi:hypothetical protein
VLLVGLLQLRGGEFARVDVCSKKVVGSLGCRRAGTSIHLHRAKTAEVISHPPNGLTS